MRDIQVLQAAGSMPAHERPILSPAVRAKTRLDHLKDAGKKELG
jgi:hypothetical protein